MYEIRVFVCICGVVHVYMVCTRYMFLCVCGVCVYVVACMCGVFFSVYVMWYVRYVRPVCVCVCDVSVFCVCDMVCALCPCLVCVCVVCIHGQFSHQVMSKSLQPHGLQHIRLSCPSPTPRACSNSCPLSR